MANIIKKSEFAGAGMFIQLLGVVFCVIAFPYGLILGLPLLIVGGLKANVHLCSDCRGKVDKKATVCPHCRARFGEPDLPTAPKGSGRSDSNLRDALR